MSLGDTTAANSDDNNDFDPNHLNEGRDEEATPVLDRSGLLAISWDLFLSSLHLNLQP